MKIFKSRKSKVLLSIGTVAFTGVIAFAFLLLSDYTAAEESKQKKGSILSFSESFLAAPAEGKVLSYFGPRTVLQNETEHLGIDIGEAEDNSTYAVAAGTVTKVYSQCTENGHVGSSCGDGYGNYIQVQHVIEGQQFETLYAHLEDTLVSEGQMVEVNEKIGTIGNSGNAVGKALHFELHVPHKNGQETAIDPLLYIPMK
ncbi:M23 family metallopeptidase [Planomicrobium okeanokoites]|uniref:M23 family metallopeptidase n=1 Tax=Planomicrobium okeanokoites TaxID=244 RepID=UPI000A02A542|nr:M23 family metallopeptidase [Planomicrobium okeanokoites]